MINEAKIIIIRGNSASGKTTIGKELQKKFRDGTMLIQQDVIRRDILCVKDDLGTKALPLIIKLVEYGKQNCKVIILEGILYSVWYKELFDKIIEDFSPNIFAYYFDLPFEETLIRHETRPLKIEFGEEEMRIWWQEKDFLTQIKEKPLTKDMTKEEIVRIILKDVGCLKFI